MSTFEFIMVIGIIIISTYVSIKVIGDIKQFLSRWTVLNSEEVEEIELNTRHLKELREEVNRLFTENSKLSEELAIERR